MRKLLIIILLLLSLPGAAHAACSNTAYGNGATCVQFVECEVLTTATSIPCAINSVGTGHLLLAFCRVGANSAITSVSDTVNAGNYTKAWEQDDATNGKVLANYYMPNTLSGNTTVTCHWTTTTTNNALDIVELSGMATSSPLDQQNSAITTSSSSPTSGNITTVNANDVIFGAVSFAFSSTITISSENNSFTQEMNDTLGTASHVHLHGADRGVSSTLTVAYNPTLSAAITTEIGVAAFKVSSGAAPAGMNKRIKLEQLDNLTAWRRRANVGDSDFVGDRVAERSSSLMQAPRFRILFLVLARGAAASALDLPHAVPMHPAPRG
jgi:hypothetical protein